MTELPHKPVERVRFVQLWQVCYPMLNASQTVMFKCSPSFWQKLRVMYRSNRSFNIPPPPRAYPGHLTPLPSRGGGNLIIRVFQGVGNLIPMCQGWGIRTAPSISCELSGVASYYWGPSIRGFSWKRLFLCGQI